MVHSMVLIGGGGNRGYDRDISQWAFHSPEGSFEPEYYSIMGRQQFRPSSGGNHTEEAHIFGDITGSKNQALRNERGECIWTWLGSRLLGPEQTSPEAFLFSRGQRQHTSRKCFESASREHSKHIRYLVVPDVMNRNKLTKWIATKVIGCHTSTSYSCLNLSVLYGLRHFQT